MVSNAAAAPVNGAASRYPDVKKKERFAWYS